jgi:transposase
VTAANLTTPETTRSGHFHTTRDGTALADCRGYGWTVPLEAIVPAPYSQDLRQRVISFVALGGSARAAAMRFDVSVSSALRWAQRWRAEGHARPRAMGGDRRSRLGEYSARVLQLVARQPDLTLQEIRGALAASCGITVGLSTVHRFLGAHNLTRKKRPYTRPSRTARM